MSTGDPFGLCPEIVDGKPCELTFGGLNFSVTVGGFTGSISVGRYGTATGSGSYVTGTLTRPLAISSGGTPSKSKPSVALSAEAGGSTSLDSFKEWSTVGTLSGGTGMLQGSVSGSVNDAGTGFAVSGGGQSASSGVSKSAGISYTYTSADPAPRGNKVPTVLAPRDNTNVRRPDMP